MLKRLFYIILIITVFFSHSLLSTKATTPAPPPLPFSFKFEEFKTEYNINDVTLKLYLASTWNQSPHRDYNNEYHSEIEEVSIRLFFAASLIDMDDWNNSSNCFREEVDWHLIKEIPDDEFFTDEYLGRRGGGKIKQGCRIILYSTFEYSHSENITIPEELFIKQSGVICFILQEDITYIDGNKPKYRLNDHFNIFYKINGETVNISEKKF